MERLCCFTAVSMICTTTCCAKGCWNGNLNVTSQSQYVSQYIDQTHTKRAHTHTHTHTHQDLHNLIQGLSAHGACQMRCTVGPIAAIAPCNGSLSSRRGSPDMWALNLTRATPFHWQLWSKSPAQRAVAIPLDSLKGCGEAWPEER